MNILLLHGSNAYLSRKRLNQIISSFQERHGESSIVNIDGSFCPAERILSEIDSLSMFNSTKIVVVRYFSENTDNKKFVEFLKETNTENIQDVSFVFWENKSVDKRSAFYKFLNQNYKVEEFKDLTGKALIKWILDEFKNSGMNVSNSVAEKIVERVGDEMWRLNSEIEKLVLYKKDGLITIDDVEKAVPMSASVEVWGLTNAIVVADKKKALSNLERLMNQGNDIYHIWGLIIWQFRQLILIKYEQKNSSSASVIASKLKISPFIVKRILNVRQSISFEKIKILYNKLVEMDFQMKTSVTDPLFAITLLLSVI